VQVEQVAELQVAADGGRAPGPGLPGQEGEHGLEVLVRPLAALCLAVIGEKLMRGVVVPDPDKPLCRIFQIDAFRRIETAGLDLVIDVLVALKLDLEASRRLEPRPVQAAEVGGPGALESGDGGVIGLVALGEVHRQKALGIVGGLRQGQVVADQVETVLDVLVEVDLHHLEAGLLQHAVARHLLLV
jgi:hypothetical protein